MATTAISNVNPILVSTNMNTAAALADSLELMELKCEDFTIGFLRLVYLMLINVFE